MTDLTKMVNKWFEETRKEGETGSDLYEILKAMAADIEKLKGASDGRTTHTGGGESGESNR